MTPSNDKTTLRFYYALLASIALTVLIVVVHAKLPMKEDDAFDLAVSSYYFTDGSSEGGSTKGRWIDGSEIGTDDPPTTAQGDIKNHFTCTFIADVENAFCGYALTFSPWDSNPSAAPKAPNSYGVDISHARYLKVKVNYQGAGTKVRVTLRSFNPAIKDKGIDSGIIVLSYLLQPSQLNSVQYLDLKDFQPVDWFLSQNTISVSEAKADLSKVLSVGLELPYLFKGGSHELEFEQLAIGSEWLPTRSLHQSLFWLWVFSLSFLSLSKVLSLRRRVLLDEQRIEQLTRSNRKLMTQSEFLKELSQRDTLTGVLNRSGFDISWRHLNTELKPPSGIAMIVVDLDHFKTINDQFGHQVGDEILRILGGLLMANVRQTDIVCRWGGEEFVVVCKVPDAQSGVDRAELIRARIEQRFHQFRFDTRVLNDEPFKGDAINVTASLGVAFATVKNNQKPDATLLFGLADKALYQAKEQGRNRVVLAGEASSN